MRTATERGKERRVEVPEALKSLIQENLIPHLGEAELLQDQAFVENEVCRGAVNEILFVNRVTLERLYNSCRQSSASASFEIADAVKLLDPLYPHSGLQIQRLFNRSKAAIFTPSKLPFDEQAKRLTQLELPEFLALVCFLAKNLVQQSSDAGRAGKQNRPLEERVTNLLQNLCTMSGY